MTKGVDENTKLGQVEIAGPNREKEIRRVITMNMGAFGSGLM